MPRRVELAQWTLGLYSAALAGGNVLLGTMVLAGGPQRMSIASFKYILQIAPYWVWGVLFIAGGLLTLFGQYRYLAWPVRVGHSLGGSMCLLWVIFFAAAAVTTPTAGLTGVAAYLILGVLHSLAAGLTIRGPVDGHI